MLATVALTVSLLGSRGSLGSLGTTGVADTRPVAATEQAGFATRKVASGWIPPWDARGPTGGWWRTPRCSAPARRSGTTPGAPASTGTPAREHAGMITGHRHRIDVVPTGTASSLRPLNAIRGTWPRWYGWPRSRAYDGIDLDYGHLALTTPPRRAARVRRAFTGFVERL